MAQLSKKLSKREIALGFITLLVLAFGYSKYWLLNETRKGREAQRQIATIEQEMIRNRTILVEVQSRQALGAKDPQQDGLIREYLRNTEKFARIIQKVVSRDPSLETKAIKIEKRASEKDFNQTTLSLVLEGSYLAIGAFIDRFEGSHTLAEIEAVDISRVESDLRKVRGKLRIKAYVQSEGKHE